jgi:hypothetical protein
MCSKSAPTAPAVAALPALDPATFGLPSDPVEIYAAGIDTSNYVARVAPFVRASVPAIGDLLDIGAGGGQLGRALREPLRRWTAIEPSAGLRARLVALEEAPHVLACGWEEAAVPAGGHDTVLAANIAAPLQQPDAFLTRCLAWARRAVIWVVPAQQGPRGLIFAGCLPSEWHGEDETPGVDIVLRDLPPSNHPHAIVFAEWTFSAVVADLGVLANYLADRLGWAHSDSRRQQIARHLSQKAIPDRDGYRLDIPRKSAVLVWGRT